MSEFWQSKKVLVTGAKGFVGANLLRGLLDVGATPIGMDLPGPAPSLAALFSDGRPYVAILDVTSECNALDLECDVIFHLAGLGHIADCQTRPAEAFRVNALGTVKILEAARRSTPPPIVVCASSNHAYLGGNPDAVPIGTPRAEGGGWGLGESCPLQATDAYGASKAAADLAVRCYRESYGLRAAAVRHVNSYGPADPHESHLVTGAILACLKGDRPQLKGDGTAVKGYLHVADVVAAYLLVAEKIDDLPGHAVNVTDAQAETTALSIARTVMEIAGLPGGPEILKQDLSQSGYQERLDPSLIRSLGWAPQLSLYDGLKATYTWYEKHGGMAWRA